MTWLPKDIPSFLLGILIGALGLFFTGFVQEAGKEFWYWIKKKIKPEPLEPIQVDGQFNPSLYKPGSCAWVQETRVFKYEQDGYSYYPHPKNGARCFRYASSRDQNSKEWLMVRPDAIRSEIS